MSKFDVKLTESKEKYLHIPPPLVEDLQAGIQLEDVSTFSQANDYFEESLYGFAKGVAKDVKQGVKSLGADTKSANPGVKGKAWGVTKDLFKAPGRIFSGAANAYKKSGELAANLAKSGDNILDIGKRAFSSDPNSSNPTAPGGPNGPSNPLSDSGGDVRATFEKVFSSQRITAVGPVIVPIGSANGVSFEANKARDYIESLTTVTP
jgi:hypothetical protein